MNIKEHIEAGHYPTDDKGRALVPMQNGDTATIYATDTPINVNGIDQPIAGFDGDGVETWQEDGRFTSERTSSLDLLPPPPRKVKVTAYAVVQPGMTGGLHWSPYSARNEAVKTHGDLVVELTGEYEEPWS